MSGPIRNADELKRTAAAGMETLYPKRLKVLVGSASCGIALGAREVEAAAVAAVKQLGLDAVVCRTGCIGFCAHEPLVDLMLPDGPRLSYGDMTPEKTRKLLEAYSGGNLMAETALGRMTSEEHLLTGEVHQYQASPRDLSSIPEWSTLDFYRRQKKVIRATAARSTRWPSRRPSPAALTAGRSAPSPR
jgi:NADP-reducing hydrogenase subunit HndB